MATKLSSVPGDHRKMSSFLMHNNFNSDSVIQQQSFLAEQSVVVVIRNMGLPVTVTIESGEGRIVDKIVEDLFGASTLHAQFTHLSLNRQKVFWRFNVKLKNLTSKITAAGGILSAIGEFWTLPPEPVPPPPQPRPRPAPSPSPSPAPIVPRIYVVKPGDYLSKIAQMYYGDPNQWRRIYDANKAIIGHNPDLIYPGQKLVIPS